MALSVCSVLTCLIALLGPVGFAGADPNGSVNDGPVNDAIASATPIDMTGDTASFFSSVSDAGATAADNAADGQLTTTDFAQHTLWYKFAPAPGLVSVTVSSADIASVVAGVVTTASPDAGLAGLSDTFSLVSNANVINTDGSESGSALAHTTSEGQSETFSFTVDAALVADTDHDYYLGIGSVGDSDAAAPTGVISLSTAYTAAPGNDDFANAEPISVAKTTYKGTTFAATPDLDANGNNVDPVVDGQSGMFSVWYAFTAPSNGRVTVSTKGSSFPVVFEVCQTSVPAPGQCGNSDVVDSGSGATPLATTTFDARDGETYYLFLDGQQVAGQAYHASGPYRLGFTFSPAAPNDDISTPTVLSPVGVDRVTGTNVGAQAIVLGADPPATISNETEHGLTFDGGQQHSVWYRYKPIKSAHMVLFTTGSLNTDVEVFRGSLSAGFTSDHAGNDNYLPGRTQSRFRLSVTAGHIYYIGIDGSHTASYPEGSFGLDLGAVPANDSLKHANFLGRSKGRIGRKTVTVSRPAGTVKGSTDFATFQSGETSPKHHTGGADTWYTFIAPRAGHYTFTESLHGGAALIAAYSGRGSSNLGLKLVKADTDSTTTKPASITIRAKAGQRVKISVDGSAGAFGAYTLRWS